MSYCRFSSDDFQCDVYVYHDCGGWWQIHVATRRHVPKEPFPADVDRDDPDWIKHDVARHVEVCRIIGECDDFKTIGLPYDGWSYQEDTPGDCADRLEVLREAGYNVPQYAIDDLRTEVEAEVEQ